MKNSLDSQFLPQVGHPTEDRPVSPNQSRNPPAKPLDALPSRSLDVQPKASLTDPKKDTVEKVQALIFEEIESLRAQQRKNYEGHRDKTIALLYRLERKVWKLVS